MKEKSSIELKDYASDRDFQDFSPAEKEEIEITIEEALEITGGFGWF